MGEIPSDPAVEAWRGHLSLAAVHVWCVRIGEAAPELWLPILSAAERARAGRFVVTGAARAFVVRRAVQRTILARYLDIPPAAVPIQQAGEGKPRLEPNPLDLRFNLSYSEDLVLCGISQGREVGVDVERVRHVPDAMAIARQFFTALESAELARVAPDVQDQAFLRCWTRKEAVVKALGQGLAVPLNSFPVLGRPDEAIALDLGQNASAGGERWTVRDLPLENGWVGAVAAQGEGWTVIPVPWSLQE